MRENFIKFLQKNITWIASICTGIAFIVSALFRLIDYFYGRVFYNFYGLDFVLYEKNYNLVSIILSVFLIGMIFTIVIRLLEDKNGLVKNSFCNTIIEKIILPFLLNIMMIYLVSNCGLLINFLSSIILYFIQRMLVKFFYPVVDDEIEKGEFKLNDGVILILVIIFYIAFFQFFVESNLKNKEEYRILDENRVVVDVNKDYYITLKYEIDEEETMHIKRGTQELIENKNIESELVKYEFVVDWWSKL